jgi:deazaflavin-dependent oxidoreductase (nitroreductase family)
MNKTTIATAPHGLLRFGLRLPIWLYRLHLGWLFGNRFLLLTHIRRKSGMPRQTVIEVVKHDYETDSFFVVSGWGNQSDWYRNIHKNPDVVINVSLRKLHVHAEDTLLSEAVDILEEYTRRYPMAFKELIRLFLKEELQPGRESRQRLAEMMPMVVFRPHN